MGADAFHAGSIGTLPSRSGLRTRTRCCLLRRQRQRRPVEPVAAARRERRGNDPSLQFRRRRQRLQRESHGTCARHHRLFSTATPFGPMFGTSASLDSTGGLPKQLAGTSLTINGVSAPLLYAQSGQLNAQAPYEIAGASEAEVIVTYNGQSSAPVRLPVAAQSTGLHPSAFVSGDAIVLFATGAGEFTPAIATGVLAGSDNLPHAPRTYRTPSRRPTGIHPLRRPRSTNCGRAANQRTPAARSLPPRRAHRSYPSRRELRNHNDAGYCRSASWLFTDTIRSRRNGSSAGAFPAPWPPVASAVIAFSNCCMVCSLFGSRST